MTALDAARNDLPPRWWHSHWLRGLALLYLVALVASAVVSGGLWRTVLLGIGVGLAIWAVVARSRNRTVTRLDIGRPRVQAGLAVAGYLVFVGASFATRANDLVSGELTKWLWLTLLPIAVLHLVMAREQSVRATLRSIGLRREGLGAAIGLGALGALVVLPFAIVSLSSAQRSALAHLAGPNLFVALPMGLVLALVTAASTEEVFFRGILQSRLAQVLGSETAGCAVTAVLFGLYHLPYALFLQSWPSHGHVVWAVSSVLTEQLPTGLLFGILWMRTHHLAAPIVCHTLINTLAIMASLKFG